MARQDATKRKQTGNRLETETPFACNVHFRADLPEIAGEPKLLVNPLQPEKLAQFRLTSIEKNPKSFLELFSKRALFLDSELGLPVNVLDIERYEVPAEPPELEPEDLALLEDTEIAVKNSQEDKGKTNKQELSWLMRTSYISNEVKARRQQQTAQTGQHSDLLSDELEAIEDGFAAAEVPPKHPSKPDMKAIEVLPILPDFDNWANKYVLVTFDDNPAREYAPLARSATSTQREVAAQGMLKSFTQRDERDKVERFVALMIPKPGTKDDSEELSDEDPGREYTWVREYKFRFDDDAEHDSLVNTCVLMLEEDQVTFSRIGSRLALQKRPRGSITRPSCTTIRKRALTQAEQDIRDSARQRLDAQEPEEDVQEEPVQAGTGGADRASPSPSLSD